MRVYSLTVIRVMVALARRGMVPRFKRNDFSAGASRTSLGSRSACFRELSRSMGLRASVLNPHCSLEANPVSNNNADLQASGLNHRKASRQPFRQENPSSEGNFRLVSRPARF